MPVHEWLGGWLVDPNLGQNQTVLDIEHWPAKAHVSSSSTGHIIETLFGKVDRLLVHFYGKQSCKQKKNRKETLLAVR
jgi:hypothetical protein